MRPVALLCVVLVLGLAASLAVAAPAPTTTTPLASTVPWSLKPRRAVPAANSTIRLPPDLPYTGDNLAPEAIAAVLLLIVGVAIRLRLRWR